MLDLSQVAVHNRTIYYRSVMSPKNHVSDFVGRDESSEAIHRAQLVEHAFIVTDMLAQHRRIGESRADQSRMNASPHEILTGGTHLSLIHI